MQVQIDIGFDQLLKIVKELPAEKLRLLKAELEMGFKDDKPRFNLESLLLNGPIATEKELETIEKNRKSINQWRTK